MTAPQTTAHIPRSKEMAAAQISAIGQAKRDLARRKAEVDEQIAALRQAASRDVIALQTRIDTLTAGLAAWANEHRFELCEGSGKTVSLPTGELRWRTRPPSVMIANQAAVLELMRKHQLCRFIRTSHEVNKSAVLMDPEAVKDIKGLFVVSGIEDFVVTPFEGTTSN